jgi:hypothetical protein
MSPKTQEQLSSFCQNILCTRQRFLHLDKLSVRLQCNYPLVWSPHTHMIYISHCDNCWSDLCMSMQLISQTSLAAGHTSASRHNISNTTMQLPAGHIQKTIHISHNCRNRLHKLPTFYRNNIFWGTSSVGLSKFLYV